MGSLILITGNDELLIKETVKKNITALCGEAFLDNSALEIIDGNSDKRKPDEILSSVIASIQTPPFLEPEKIIWLKHFSAFEDALSGTAKSRKGKPIERLNELLKTPLPDDVTLIMDGPGVKKNTTFFKTVNSMGKVQLCEKIEQKSKDFIPHQTSVIKELAGKAGKGVSSDAVSYLIEITGSDYGRLSTEIEKLILYTVDRTNITLDDCKKISSRTPEALAWEFADSLVEFNTKKALETISIISDQMRAARGASNPELSILIMAINRFQQIVNIKAGAQLLNIPPNCSYSVFKSRIENLTKEEQELLSDTPLLTLNPYRVFKTFESVANIPNRKLTTAIRELLNANKMLVSTSTDPRIILEKMAIAITR